MWQMLIFHQKYQSFALFILYKDDSKPMTRYIITLLDSGIILFEISYTMVKKFNDWFLKIVRSKNFFKLFF